MPVFPLRVLAAGVAIFLVYPVLAQPPEGGGGRGRGGRGFGGMMPQDPALLALNKSVQDELKLTDEQKAGLKTAGDKFHESMSKARDASDREKAVKSAVEDAKKDVDKVKESFKPEQTKRLKQIQLQVAGIRAFANEDVQKELKLTDKQKDDVKEIVDGVNKDVEELRKNGGGPGGGGRRGGMRQKIQDLNKDAMEKVSGLLTEDQKKTWKDMTGEKFELRFEGFGGDQGGGRRRNRGQNNDNN